MPASRGEPSRAARNEPGILHADLDSFYASVEQRDQPRLLGRPVIVGAGVVLAASYEAKAFGVQTAMGLRQARALCPRAVVVPARMSAYSEASQAVFAVFGDTSPLVEPLSVDEAFIDVRGLAQVRGDAHQIATRLRRTVADRVGLPITVGVARTKFLAKVASGVAKPDGLLVVPVGGELAFLHPLPVRRLWGVGRITAEKLRQRGILTVGDVAALELPALIALLGAASGRHLHALAHNRDPRPVVVGRRRRSIGAQSALGWAGSGDPESGRPGPSLDELGVRLMALVDRVARRLRSAHRLCRTVVLRLRFADFARITRSHTLAAPTAQTPALLAALLELLQSCAALIASRGITLIGVALANLDDTAAVQPELPFDARDLDRLDGAIDQVRDRYGSSALVRAALVGARPELGVPMLPD
jgi:DNA polymerase IV